MPDALIVFGSVARGTETTLSDVDLLAVGGNIPSFSVKSNGVEIQNYTLEKFMSLAANGDLFGAHIAMEGKVIYDPSDIFVRYRESYTLKENYSHEKSNAFDLANYLLFNADFFSNRDLVARRVAWCIRTVLIANLAEKRKFVFSPEGLCREYPYTWAKSLIDLRRSGSSKVYKPSLVDFLNFFGKLRMPLPEEKFLEIFSVSNNDVALGTLKHLRENTDDTRYSTT